jgi:hypothetical protein
MERFNRNIRLFGAEGQKRIRTSHVAVIGCGGLGEQIVQQLACLGVGTLTLVDDEELCETNRNRYVLARHTDGIPGTHKVDIAERAVAFVDPDIVVHPVRAELRSEETFAKLRHADTVFGCLDNDGTRLVLNEFALAYEKQYFDLATDVEKEDAPRYGGRVSLIGRGPGCLVCRELIDINEARNELEDARARKDRATIYGVDESLLDAVGPSVVSINGVVASLAVTEFMVAMTGLREPRRHLTYRGDLGIVIKNADSSKPDCYYCNVVQGAGERAGVERFVR